MLDSVKLTFQLNAILLNACQKLAVSGYLPYSYSAQRGYLSSKHNAIYHHSVVYSSAAPNHIIYGILDGQRHNDSNHCLVISMHILT